MSFMKYVKNEEPGIQKYRFYIQAAFVLICLWIGLDFYFFAEYLESGGTIDFSARPPGAEAFLPISSLMSLYYFFLSGEIHGAHPAGFFMFIAILSVSFLVGKSFCSWICPVGFLSELVGDFGDKISKKLFKKTLKLPRFLDYPLRSLKYLILGFFAWAIFVSMSEVALKHFLDSSYNIISDVKMYYFFVDISQFALIVLSVLFILSIFITNFWCRYLCPYGALLGFIGLFSPNKIKRNSETCIDCSLCAKACPSNIKVDKVSTVVSDECTSCLNCIDVCPVSETLDVKTFGKKKLSKVKILFIIVFVYSSIILSAMLTGNWQNNISKEEYLELYKVKDKIGHIRSSEDIEKLNKDAKGK
ncbi:MAG: 4Fe-4S binding protein [Melioribacteraceae bacterium]|nr:4Fe-4S binding protein [Melioribacteraceae bacterium]